MSNLPLGWEYGELLTLAYIVRGVTYSKNDVQSEKFQSSIPVLRANNIQSRGFVMTDLVYVPSGLVSEKQRILKGDVVVASSSGSINIVGKAVQASVDMRAGFGAFCTLVRPTSELDLRYFGYYFSTETYRTAVSEMARGVNINNLKREHFARLQIPLAPRAEQTRIADQLGTLLARIQACNDRLDAIPALLKRFRQAVLLAAIRGQLSESASGRGSPATQGVKLGEDQLLVPASWQVIELAAAIDPSKPLCYGVVQPGDDVAGGVPLVRVQDMESGTVLANRLRTVSRNVDDEYRRSRVVGGEVLVSVVGTIGRTAVVPDGLDANIARAVARVACREGIAGRWVHYWLSTERLQSYLLNCSKEVARKTLNLSDLARIPLAVPGPTEQQLIIDRVSAYFKIADKIEELHRSSSANARRLTALTLAKAFRGDLVPQDPDDEPASALLARIAAQRTAPAEFPPARTPRRGRPPRALKEAATMTKSRQDQDVMNQPYLAQHLRRIGTPTSAQALFKVAELPVADFYKQLTWEVAHGHVHDNQTTLEPGHAAG